MSGVCTAPSKHCRTWPGHITCPAAARSACACALALHGGMPLSALKLPYAVPQTNMHAHILCAAVTNSANTCRHVKWLGMHVCTRARGLRQSRLDAVFGCPVQIVALLTNIGSSEAGPIQYSVPQKPFWSHKLTRLCWAGQGSAQCTDTRPEAAAALGRPRIAGGSACQSGPQQAARSAGESCVPPAWCLL